MDNRFTAGELASLSGLSKQAILFYDKKGILKPEYIDPHNHYRYYTADQLELLDSILMLKEMGLSLEEIRAFLAHRSDRQAVATMKTQKQKIRRKIRSLQLVEKRLSRKIQMLEQFYEDDHSIRILTLPQPEPIAIEPVCNPGTLLSQDIALKKLLSRAREAHYPYYYQQGVMLPLSQLRAGNYLHAEFVFLPLEHAHKGANCAVRDQGLYASYFYVGPYLQIGDAYRTLLGYLDQNGFLPGTYAYEYCILDSLTSPDSQEYVTRILIPVSPGEQTAVQKKKKGMELPCH